MIVKYHILQILGSPNLPVMLIITITAKGHQV